MYKIVKKKSLNPTVTLMEIDAPLIAKKAEPGQFIILRVDENGERIPLTVAGYDREAGTVRIIFQIVGATTEKLNHLNEGDYIHDFVGPLGVPTHTDGLKKVCVVGGGVGCAIALPVAEKLHEIGCEVHSIVGFRNKDLVILEDEFKACSDKFILMTDDGSYGQKGVVTAPLEEMIKAGEDYDLVITIGPLIMMKFVVKTTKPYNIPTTVSMNPIMIDGTGMCGGCRLTVDGQTKFACVDGPDFDGFKVDFDEAMKRGAMYKPFERHAYEETCNLFKKELEDNSLFLGMLNLFLTGRKLFFASSVNNINLFCAKTLCTTSGIHCNITAADNCNLLCVHNRSCAVILISLHKVCSCEELICRVNTAKVLTGDIHKSRKTCARTDKY